MPILTVITTPSLQKRSSKGFRFEPLQIPDGMLSWFTGLDFPTSSRKDQSPYEIKWDDAKKVISERVADYKKIESLEELIKDSGSMSIFVSSVFAKYSE